MTDEELAAIERAGRIMGGRGGWRLDDPHSPAIAIERLVAEVRRLRAELVRVQGVPGDRREP